MTEGQILLGIGCIIFYITFQIVPLFNLIGACAHEKMDIVDLLFFPLMAAVILIPFAGAIVGLVFHDEDCKWLHIAMLISICLIIAGIIFEWVL